METRSRWRLTSVEVRTMALWIDTARESASRYRSPTGERQVDAGVGEPQADPETVVQAPRRRRARIADHVVVARRSTREQSTFAVVGRGGRGLDLEVVRCSPRARCGRRGGCSRTRCVEAHGRDHRIRCLQASASSSSRRRGGPDRRQPTAPADRRLQRRELESGADLSRSVASERSSRERSPRRCMAHRALDASAKTSSGAIRSVSPASSSPDDSFGPCSSVGRATSRRTLAHRLET